jgi:hypothetical protein
MAPTFVLMLLAILAFLCVFDMSDAILAVRSVLLGFLLSKDRASRQTPTFLSLVLILLTIS